jgi:hypothetical protein
MRTPTFPAKIITGISTLGQTSQKANLADKPVPPLGEDGFHVPYTWLTIMVTDDFNGGITQKCGNQEQAAYPLG